MVALSPIDLAIVFIYFAFVLGIGIYFARREKMNEEAFFVGGRNVGWFAIGASLFASNISSEHLIGLSADGFRTGLAVGNYEWGACLVLVILALLFVPFYIGSRISTLPEFLEKRFGLGARMYLSIVTLAANVLVRISVALYAGAIVLQELFGIGFWPSILGLAITTVVYTAMGGLAAVIYTDVLQAVILLVGTIILTVIAMDQVGGWAGLRASLDPSFFDMVRPADDPEMPWVGLVLGVPIVGIWYWCTDQVITQRVLAAKDIPNARKGVLFAGFLKILPVFLFVLPGLCGRVLFPDIESITVFPTLLANLLPVGVLGLVAAALIAALMSSIDSTLNSTGTLFALDFYKRFKKGVTSEQLVRVGRWTTVVVMIFGIAWVQVVERAESLFQYLQQVNAAISPPITAVFLGAVLWKRANHTGAMACLLGGLVVGLGLLSWGGIAFLISAAITFAVSIVLLVGGSLMSAPPPTAKTDGLCLSTVTVSMALNRQTKIATGLLLATVFSLWAYFF